MKRLPSWAEVGPGGGGHGIKHPSTDGSTTPQPLLNKEGNPVPRQRVLPWTKDAS
jgi:hypothetical protein